MSEQKCSDCLEDCKVLDDEIPEGHKNCCLYYRDEDGSVLEKLREKYERH